jgi:hypothetical protein|tara:strand:+ start:433 stop:651 length:219 start_codon:yes stop_codon:yes gene_type:complete
MEAVERKLKNISQSQVAISDRPPSLNEMSDGDSIYARVSGKYLRLYIRVGSKLYYSSFTPVEENNNTWKNLD